MTTPQTFQDRISCPCCGNDLHSKAFSCPSCGFQAETSKIQGLLGSLSTVCSILVGFGLASSVTLAAENSSGIFLQIANGMWLFASVLLLAVLVTAEFIRHQEVSDCDLAMTDREKERIQRRCGFLLIAFGSALLLVAIGIVVMGFHFSLIHGLIGGLAVILSFVLIWKLMRM